MNKNVDIENILSNMPDKLEDTNTTSKKFKRDLHNFLSHHLPNSKDMKALELGTSHGHTTGILALSLKEVITFDKHESNLKLAKTNNSNFDNISYVEKDLYEGVNPLEEYKLDFDIAFVDCMHKIQFVSHDIWKLLTLKKNKKVVMIFDDYGLNWGPNSGHVKTAVDYFIENGYLKVIEKIGLKKGDKINDDAYFGDSEGIICETTNKNSKEIGTFCIRIVGFGGGTVIETYADDIFRDGELIKLFREIDKPLEETI